MARSYLSKHAESTRVTPQSEPLDGMVANSAGGFTYTVTPMMRLRRFLVLGSEGGSYYASEHDLTKQNVTSLKTLLKQDGVAVVNEIVQVSVSGRAPKNDQALFALAYAISHGDKATKKAAAEALPHVARIGTHLFQFLTFATAMRGWGASLKWAVKNWYEVQADLPYQAVKYRQRDGWSHRDVLRKAHVNSIENREAFGFITGHTGNRWTTDESGRRTVVTEPWAAGKDTPKMIKGFLKAQKAATPESTAKLVDKYGLPREALRTEHLTDVAVWDALLRNQGNGMPMTAMIRNLANMTRAGLVAPNSEGTKLVIEALADKERITKARVHPMAILMALRTYEQGQGFRGTNTWEPVVQVVDALNDAFYLAFDNVERTNLRYLLALDVSGSMGSPFGNNPLTCRDASAAMALVTAATEPNYETVGFTSGRRNYNYSWYTRRDAQDTDGLTPLAISPRQRLTDAINTVSGLDFGGTDCSLPMLYALKMNREVDVFVVYTDSETWAGRIQPVQALRQYREKTGINAKLIVVGMVANEFSIADPNDPGMLDVVGFDTSTPRIMSDFAMGRI